jgi:hypothetical protein
MKRLINNIQPSYFSRAFGFKKLYELSNDDFTMFSNNNLTIQINHTKTPAEKITMKLSEIKSNYRPDNINDSNTKENIFNILVYIFINSPNPIEPSNNNNNILFNILNKLNNEKKIIFIDYYKNTINTGGKRKTRKHKKSTKKNKKNKRTYKK